MFSRMRRQVRGLREVRVQQSEMSGEGPEGGGCMQQSETSGEGLGKEGVCYRGQGPACPTCPAHLLCSVAAVPLLFSVGVRSIGASAFWKALLLLPCESDVPACMHNAHGAFDACTSRAIGALQQCNQGRFVLPA